MEESAARLVEKKLDAFCREEKEGWLLRGVHEEIQSVKRQLGLLTAILGVAGENPDPCRQLQAWVNKVRQVSYDAEDALDEYFWVCFRKRRGGLYTKILFSVKDMMRARVAARIQSLKSRVTECAQSYPYAYPSFVPSGPIREDTRWLALWIPEKDPVGMDKPKDDLVRLLHVHDGGSGLKVVSIVGMGGLGKTTLAAKVFQDVKTNFEVCARIKVSQTYNFMELLQQIVRGVYQGMNQPTPQQVQSMRDGDVNLLAEFVLNLLRPKTYLILLDDVWSINDWNTLQMVLPDNQCCGSRILLTTRNRGVAVASTMTGKGEFYELSPLSSEDSWSLFCKKTFRGSPCPSRLKTNCQRIVERCGGLPLAIVAISHNLAPRVTSHFTTGR